MLSHLSFFFESNFYPCGGGVGRQTHFFFTGTNFLQGKYIMKSILTIADTQFVFDSAKDAIQALEVLSKARVVKEVPIFGDDMEEFRTLCSSVPFEMTMAIKPLEIATEQQVKAAINLYDIAMKSYRQRRADSNKD
jgi:hypothetical protein